MAPSAVVIKNINVFDGKGLTSKAVVAFKDGLLVENVDNPDLVIDGQGKYLFPGLIDCHIHIHAKEDLSILARHGVTTCLDMGTRTLEVFGSLRGGRGTCDVRSPGMIATSPGSRHSKIPGFPQEVLVRSPADAEGFVAKRVSEGADYIKVMADNPGPDQATIDALVEASHGHGKKIIAHAASCEAFAMALAAKVDVITHVPLEKTLDVDMVAQIKRANCLAVPTLIKMLKTEAKSGQGSDIDYSNAREAVGRLKNANIPILAGTDANKHGSGPGKVPYEGSMYEELELLVAAGLSPLEAIQSATTLPPRFFNLEDRGSIEHGKRADLIILSANPLEDIRNVRQIERVWCGGIEVS